MNSEFTKRSGGLEQVVRGCHQLSVTALTRYFKITTDEKKKKDIYLELAHHPEQPLSCRTVDSPLFF